MNKDQRKYLIDEVTKIYKNQRDKITMPEAPSLNNYLIAAFLDNSIKMKDPELLKKRIRERVLKMGHNDVLLIEKSERGYWRSRPSEKDDENIVQISPADLFEYPENFLKARREYEQQRDECDSDIEKLDAEFKTVMFKLNISSDKALENLIQEADNLGSISLVNNTLSLGVGKKQNEITDGK